MTEKPTPAELLDLLASKAKVLRSVGVLRVELDGCKFELAPDDEPVQFRPSGPAPDEVPVPDESYPLDDPMTYGLRGGKVPGFSRVRRIDASEID